MLGTTRPRRVAILTALAVLGAGVVTGVVQAATSPDFAVTATPATTTVNATSTATWTVGASTADNFDGNVAFTVTGAPAGVSFNAPVVDLTPATSGTATLSANLSNVQGGIYPLVITGTSGAVTHSVTVSLRVRGFTVTMTPTSRSVAPGFNTTYSISVAAVAGYTGTVTLTRSGFPPLTTTTSLTNASRALTAVSPAYTASLTVAPTVLQAPGTFPFTVVASGTGTPNQTLNGTLVVAPRSVSVTSNPTKRVVVLGGPNPLTASYPLTITRFFTSGTATLSLPSGLPAGVTGGFTPSPTTGSTSALNLTVAPNTAVGTYPIPIRVAIPGFTGNSSVTLVVEQQGQPFTVSGPPPATGELSPGVSVPLDLAISNPNGVPITVTALSATVTGTSVPACGAENYGTTAYSGGPLVIPANSTRTLSSLNVPQAQWPQVTMLNLPVNQNACMGVTVSLQYSGSANGGEQP